MATMQVETFEVTEVDCVGQPEIESEAIELIERLELDGQKKLLKPDESGDVSRIPYRKMTADEKFIYEQICPESCSLRSFSESAIPVRVLQVAAHAIDLFDDVKVWHAENADIKDPVLVGVNKAADYSEEFFMLARWGEVLEPLASLKEKAVIIARDKRKKALQEIRDKVAAMLSSIDEAAFDYLRQKRMPAFYE